MRAIRLRRAQHQRPPRLLQQRADALGNAGRGDGEFAIELPLRIEPHFTGRIEGRAGIGAVDGDDIELAPGLLHGSQPDALILCHDPSRTHIVSWPDYPLPGLEEARDLYLRMARMTNPGARLAGVSLNTSALDDAAAQEALVQAERALGVPAFDPMRTPLERAVAALLD